MQASKTDKQLALSALHQFVNEGNKLTVQRYSRLVRWLSGDRFVEIAMEDNVTSQAVAKSVNRDYARLQEFMSKMESE